MLENQKLVTEFRLGLIDYVVLLLKQKNTSPEMAATILGLVNYLNL